MARNIFLGSVVLCLLCVGLSQVSDPSVFGIHEEPERIMFYGGSGLLAGLFGLVAAVAGISVGANRFSSLSNAQRRFMLTIISFVLIAVMIAVMIRLYLNQ
jgi:ABC-type Na+ efflux pump permease subunit